MYCTECGGVLSAATGQCPRCVVPAMVGPTTSGALLAPSAAPGQLAVAPQVTARVKEASKDATTAFKTFATNPVGGLPVAFHSLGPTRSMGAGIVFAVCSILCVFIGVYVVLPSFAKPDLADSFKFILFGAVPFVSLLAASAVTRKAFGGHGSLHGDSFIAGASLLPFGFLVLASSLLGFANLEIAALLVVFALCYGILMLFTGVTRISNVSESRAAFAVPVMIIASFWITKIIFGAMLPSMLPSPTGLMPFGL